MKKGDKFRVIKEYGAFKVGDIVTYFRSGLWDMLIFKNELGEEHSMWYGCGFENEVEPVKEVITLKYKIDDVLVDDNGSARTILGICGKVYLMSYTSDQEMFHTGYTQKELDNDGWKLDTDDGVEEAIALLERKGKLKNGKIFE